MGKRLDRVLRCGRCRAALAGVRLTRCDVGSRVSVTLELPCCKPGCHKAETFELTFINKGPVPSGRSLREALSGA